MSGWKFYFPGDGQDEEDAVPVPPTVWNSPDDVAQYACEYDYHQRDGWERDADSIFSIIVTHPDRGNYLFKASHEQTVNHTVRRG